MNKAELLERISHLAVWKKGDQRAPHKPLLILYALGQWQLTRQKHFLYANARPKLVELLIEYGPKRKSYHPEQPFVRLERDGIWELDKPILMSSSFNKALIDYHVSGGFTTEVYQLLETDGALIDQIANLLLELHFPETLHNEILQAVGLQLTYYRRRKRDPEFRERVLSAYQHQCAICGFQVKLNQQVIGLEAAHIKWHNIGGPDREENGLALCSLHHKLFDRGVVAISHDHQIHVSEQAVGNETFYDYVKRYDKQPLHRPLQQSYFPKEEFIYWHVKEVYKGEVGDFI
ncbi:phosphorothioated DNA-binding restriction endonuclease [Gracilibacillus kekensis]|uniref:Putative restriction endonuclease n=1 Tax=Gracilibacillus kekensis TaxID=1027249 RepID=A0A1M7LE39_9BACI|nr:HNH endonuclease [Gracilibacillus kekensis]SHM76383.1 putative restriction endonuclease [Gracilibacillus kekensis]